MGCSRRNARRVVTEAHKEWMDLAFGDDNVDQRDLLFQCIARLERTARKAEEAGNYACVIGAVAQMNRMLSLGADTRGFRGHPTHSSMLTSHGSSVLLLAVRRGQGGRG